MYGQILITQCPLAVTETLGCRVGKRGPHRCNNGNHNHRVADSPQQGTTQRLPRRHIRPLQSQSYKDRRHDGYRNLRPEQRILHADFPVETSDDDDIEVLCSAYQPDEDGSIGQLSEIESDEEWDMIEEVFNTYMSNMEDMDDDEECDCDDDDCCCHHDEEEE